NDALTITPLVDHEFAELARERTRRHPLRTWLEIPLQRIATLWLTPRVELLPYTGRVTPLKDEWEYDREDLLVSLALWLVNLAYLLMAAAGCSALWNRHSCLSSEVGKPFSPPPGA